MTSIQKLTLAVVLIVVVGAGIYEMRRTADLQGQVEALQQQVSASVRNFERLNSERKEAVSQLTALQEENRSLYRAAAEVPKLRGEVARLRAIEQHTVSAESTRGNLDDPFTQSVLGLISRAVELHQHLEQAPERKIPELQLLTENDWLSAAKEATLDVDAEVRKAFSRLRSLAKAKLPLGSALFDFTRENHGQLPTDLSQLNAYFKFPIDNAILQRYALLHTGKIDDFPPGTWFIAEKAPVDKDYDSRAKFGIGTSTVIGTGIGEVGDED